MMLGPSLVGPSKLKISWGATRHRTRSRYSRGFKPLVAVELFGLVVQSHSLGSAVHEAESGDAELFAGFVNSCHPSILALERLSSLEHLLGHHLAPLVQHQVSLCEAALGSFRGTIPDLAHGSGLHLLGHGYGK